MHLIKDPCWICETKIINENGSQQTYKDTISHTESLSKVIDYLLLCKLSHQKLASAIVKRIKNGG